MGEALLEERADGQQAALPCQIRGTRPQHRDGADHVAARSVEGEDKQTLLFGVATAYTLVMPAGVQIKIDDGEPIPLQYTSVFPLDVRPRWS